MTTNIKPCPFCGSTNVFCIADENQGHKWGRAECANCGARSGDVRTGYDTSDNAPWHQDAFDEWNTRFEETEDE